MTVLSLRTILSKLLKFTFGYGKSVTFVQGAVWPRAVSESQALLVDLPALADPGASWSVPLAESPPKPCSYCCRQTFVCSVDAHSEFQIPDESHLVSTKHG